MWNNLNPNNQKVRNKYINKFPSYLCQISLTENHGVVNINYPMCNINHPKFPCRICAKNVHGKDKADMTSASFGFI